MRKLRNILMCAALSGMFAGCVDLDIPPKNILSGEDIYNEAALLLICPVCTASFQWKTLTCQMMVSIMVSLIGIALFGI